MQPSPGGQGPEVCGGGSPHPLRMAPTRLGGDVCSENKEVIRLKPAGSVIRELNQERMVPDPSDTLRQGLREDQECAI